jgi:hypothetical protein
MKRRATAPGVHRGSTLIRHPDLAPRRVRLSDQGDVVLTHRSLRAVRRGSAASSATAATKTHNPRSLWAIRLIATLAARAKPSRPSRSQSGRLRGSAVAGGGASGSRHASTPVGR